MKQSVKSSLAALLMLVLGMPSFAAHNPSPKHLKRALCLQLCATDIAASCVPHRHFHQCRSRLIRGCQHRKPGVCVSTATTTTTTLGSGRANIKGALTATPGRFNYNLTLGLPGANAACNTSFAGTHACSYGELQTAATAGALVGLHDTAGMTVTSFWAIDSSQPALQQCNDDAAGGSGLNWQYATAHTASRGQRVALDNAAGTLGALESSVQCNISGTSWVGCCQ